jgi:hypothetical protein
MRDVSPDTQEDDTGGVRCPWCELREIARGTRVQRGGLKVGYNNRPGRVRPRWE